LDLWYSPGIALRPLGVFEPLFLFLHFFGILRAAKINRPS